MIGLADCDSGISARFAERFEPEPNSGCWLWLGAMVGNVHPVVSRSVGRPIRASAARISYEMAKGEIPAGYIISQKCGNASCVNPDHLYPRKKNSRLSGREAYRHEKPKQISAERLRELVSYDPETGAMIWRVRRNQRSTAGAPVGTRADSYGRRVVVIDGRMYKMHRLIWLYMVGSWPREYIDHIDGNPANNCWGNLREATPLQNSRNAKRPSHNKSGYKGVFFSSKDKKWLARIRDAGRQVHLGSFGTAEEAYAAYCAAAERYHREFARIE